MSYRLFQVLVFATVCIRTRRRSSSIYRLSYSSHLSIGVTCPCARNTPSPGAQPPATTAPTNPMSSHGQSPLFNAHIRPLRERCRRATRRAAKIEPHVNRTRICSIGAGVLRSMEISSGSRELGSFPHTPRGRGKLLFLLLLALLLVRSRRVVHRSTSGGSALGAP